MSVAAEERPDRGKKEPAPILNSLLTGFTYKRQLWLLLLPYLLGLLVLVMLPALLSVPFAFTDYDALSPPEWVGLDNFREIFSDRLFWNGLGVSLFFIVTAIPLRALVALLLAFLLHKPRRSSKLYRSIIYLPTIIPDVAYALLWLYIFNPLYGPLNWILPLFGQKAEGWLLEPWPAKFAVVIMMLLPIGEGFVLMLAALQDIPGELEDASKIDGATGWQRFRFLTMPLLAPALILLVFRDTALSFQTTFVPSLITFEGGSPYYATLFLPAYVWQYITEHQRFGYAAGMTWVMYAITAAIIALQFLVIKRWRGGINA